MSDRHVVLEVVLPLHDGDELSAALDDSDTSVTLQVANLLDLIDNHVQVTYLVNHGDSETELHMHSEPGIIVKIRLDDEQWLEFTTGRELGGEQ